MTNANTNNAMANRLKSTRAFVRPVLTLTFIGHLTLYASCYIAAERAFGVAPTLSPGFRGKRVDGSVSTRQAQAEAGNEQFVARRSVQSTSAELRSRRGVPKSGADRTRRVSDGREWEGIQTIGGGIKIDSGAF